MTAWLVAHARGAGIVLLVFTLLPTHSATAGSDAGYYSPSPTEVGAVSSTCEVGTLGNPTAVMTNSALQVYQLLDSATCSQCPSGVGLAVDAAVWSLVFHDACTIIVRVSIVNATGSANCLFPDTTSKLCEPQLFILSESAPSRLKDYVMPFASPCCISHPAFLKIEIASQGCSSTELVYAELTHCQPCRQYWVAPAVGVHAIGEFCDYASGNLRLFRPGRLLCADSNAFGLLG